MNNSTTGVLKDSDTGPRVLRIPSVRRRTISDISELVHCSIVGTCLTTAEARKVLHRIVGDRAATLSDHLVHNECVRMASKQGLPSKTLTKILDQKYAGPIRKFGRATNDHEISLLWREAKEAAAIEGAYWAIATHPRASEELFASVFGDIHMLSHLLGSANRADLKKLVELQSENQELREEGKRLRRELSSGFSKRDREISNLQALLARSLHSQPSETDDHAEKEIGTLKRLTMALERERNSLRDRLRRVEEERQHLLVEMRAVREQCRADEIMRDAMRREIDCLEAHISHVTEQAFLTSPVAGKSILHIGGTPKSLRAMQSASEELGSNLVTHDGGIEESLALLPGLIGRADIVMIPVSMVSHQAVQAAKRYSDRAGKPLIFLSSTGLASFIRACLEYCNTSQSEIS